MRNPNVSNVAAKEAKRGGKKKGYSKSEMESMRASNPGVKF